MMPFQDRQQQLPIIPYSAAKDGYSYGWNNVGDLNWPQQQMPQFPMKPLEQFQTKQMPSIQSDSIQQELTAAGQSPSKLNNWPITGLNLPNVQVPVANYPNHINEEVLPDKLNGEIGDVPVGDRKKDGKHLFNHSKTDSTSSDDSDYNDEEEETTTEPPKKKKKHRKITKTEKTKKDNKSNEKDSIAHQMKAIHSELQTEFMDHDGEADRPGGAVVSLAFGVLITIGLVMVISCRTTAVRKRIRRSGKGYAHDADFLVNGMYL